MLHSTGMWPRAIVVKQASIKARVDRTGSPENGHMGEVNDTIAELGVHVRTALLDSRHVDGDSTTGRNYIQVSPYQMKHR